MSINYPVLVAYLVVTFLVCGIPFGKIIARARGVDIQKVGSGNIGTTNVAREIGKGAAALTLLFDAGKGALATGLALWFFPAFITGGASVAPHGDAAGLEGLVTLAAICGHIFSPFLHFHGGKGIAVAVGCLFVTFGVMGALLEIAVFAVVVAISRFVSAGSLAAAIVCPIFAAYYFLFQAFDPIAWVLCLITALVVIWAHRGNIHRLATGTERRIGDKAKE